MDDWTDDWDEAIRTALGHRHVVVVGATDVGKSSFIRRFSAAHAAEVGLIDADPGQKMVGPPGSVSFGPIEPSGRTRLERFIFLGSMSASAIGAIARSSAILAELAARAGPFIVNTSGYVRGPGVRLQAMTVAAVAADLIVEIAADPSTPSIVPTQNGGRLIRISPSPLARRKSPSMRAATRQKAFEAALAGSLARRYPRGLIRFDPAPPNPGTGAERPICALADADGDDMCIGILEALDDEAVIVRSAVPPRPASIVRVGRMWAKATEEGWRLLERQHRSWRLGDAA